MSCDVEQANSEPSPARGGQTVEASDYMPPTRPEKEGYFVYDCEVDMIALASMSLPIAVQCEKLLNNRYTLMDYILRAVVKACSGGIPAEESVDVIIFEDSGQKLVKCRDMRHKSIYQCASGREDDAAQLEPQGLSPNIVICDSYTEREQVRHHLESYQRTRFAMAIRGGRPKGDIQVGCKLKSMLLSYTFYISSEVPQQEADHIAARLNALLYDPVSLLFIT